MKQFLLFFIFSFTIITAQKKSRELAFKPSYNTSLSFTSKDKKFSTKIGGRIMIDHAVVWESDLLKNSFTEEQVLSGTEIRRMFLFTSGKVYENIHYAVQTDLTQGRVAFRDAYIGLRKLPIVGNIRVGQVKEPFRFENLNSSNYLTFLERSTGADFIPLRNNGVLLFNEFWHHQIGVQLGAFRNASGTTANDKDAGKGYAITGRINGNPYENIEKNSYLHLGLAFSYRKPDESSYQIRSKPEVNLSNISYLNTGLVNGVDKVSMVNFESVLHQGGFHLQSEYTLGHIKTAVKNQVSSFYVDVAYLLTGEHKKLHTFYDGYDRLIPAKNYGKNGWGALELAVRYSQTDLETDVFNGNQQNSWTAGLNWYLNPLTKVMFNYVVGNIKNQGTFSGLQTRFQINF